MLAYRLLRALLRLVMRVFFRQVEVVGTEHIPASGAVLFAGNHPNSLIDPVLILTTSGRTVHFAAKDTLFKGRILRVVLRGLGAVPIARRDDHPGKKTDNEAAFAAMFDVLHRGGAIGIFPEGLSHDASQLATLKTGAARLAFGAGAEAPITIVPCGLSFVHPKRFRSRVLVQYGAPIDITPERLARHRGDPVAAVRELTADLERGLRALTVNAVDWDTVRALDAVRRLYQPLGIAIDDRVELARRFNAHYPRVMDDPRVVSLMARVGAYQERLDDLGITDRELASDVSAGRAAAKVARYLALLLFWLPLAAVGAPLHLPLLGLAWIAERKLTPRKDVIATTKVISGLLFALLAYTAVVAAAAWWGGWAIALLAALVLPVSGYATLKVLDRIALLRRGFAVLKNRLRFRRQVETLREERSALAEDVGRLVDQLRPPDLKPLFPRPEAAP